MKKLVTILFLFTAAVSFGQKCPAALTLQYPCDTLGNHTYGNYDIANQWILLDTGVAILRRLLHYPTPSVTACPPQPLNYPCDAMGNGTWGNWDNLNEWVITDTLVSLLRKLSGGGGVSGLIPPYVLYGSTSTTVSSMYSSGLGGGWEYVSGGGLENNATTGSFIGDTSGDHISFLQGGNTQFYSNGSFPFKLNGSFIWTLDLSAMGSGYRWQLPAANGTTGQVLTYGVPMTWTTPSTGTVTGSGTAPQIAYWNSTTGLTGNAAHTFNANHSTAIFGTGTLQSNANINSLGNVNSYYQVLVQNANAGTLASTDVVVNNNGDSTNYADVGINSSANADPSYTAMSPSDAYYYSNKSSVVLGTAAARDSIKFVAGGTLKANEVCTMTQAGIVTNVHLAADTMPMPVVTAAYTPKYKGEQFLYIKGGDTTLCLYNGKYVDSTTLNIGGINYTETWVGFSAAPSGGKAAYFWQNGLCYDQIQRSTNGTSNTDSCVVTLPFASGTAMVYAATYTVNGGSIVSTGPSLCSTVANSKRLVCSPSPAIGSAGWTTTLGKNAVINITYSPAHP